MNSTNPDYRLRNLKRQMRDLLMGRRLAADTEATGVVDMRDFGKRCDTIADFAAQSIVDLAEARGPEGVCARRVAEEVELATRLAARLETLPRSKERIFQQCEVLEEAARLVDAALDAACLLTEEPRMGSLSAIAGKERKLLNDVLAFEGAIRDAAPGLVDRGMIRRTLRRALVEHETGPFELSVSRDGVLRFGEFEFRTESVAGALPRGANEPPEVKKALDLHDAAPDPALKEFLLVKAVDEALFALLSPQLRGHVLSEKARGLPQKPGKRGAVRPEAVRRAVDGWDEREAAKSAEKLAARRSGPEWARLPKGAYLLRLFLSEDDQLAADVLALGPILRRMEKGEPVDGARERAERALRALLGMLGDVG